MQPDPLLFLQGIRREVLRAGEDSLSRGDTIPGVTLLRGGELLANLALRHGALPEILRGFRQQQLVLLNETCALMDARGVQIPGHIRAVAETAVAGKRSLAGDQACTANHDPIRHYEELVAAQSHCLELLSAAGVRNGLLEKACALQLAVISARDNALASAADGGVAPEEEESAPTDALVTGYLREQFPQYPNIEVRNIRQLKGVNTKEVFFMDIHGHPHWPVNAVMRRNRRVDTVDNEVSSEFGILDYLHRAGHPVARPLFAGDGMASQRRSFVVLEQLPGKTCSVAELGSDREKVFAQLAGNLARLHRQDHSGLGSQYRLYGGSPRERTLGMIERFYLMWKDNDIQPSAIIESAYIWLRENVSVVDDKTCIVHADYSLRNNLVHNGEVTGILDWELAHIGHPAEDLGYIRPDIENVMAWGDFLAAYREQGGPDVSDRQVRYFQIYGLAFIMATLASACNGYLRGRHSDLLIGAAGTIEWNVHEPLLGRLLMAELA